MKIIFICPFNLNQLTGTPIRAKTTIKAAETFATVTVVANHSPRGIWSFTRAAWRELKADPSDVAHGFTTLSMVPILLFKFFSGRRLKVVFEMHGWAWFETRGRLSLGRRLIFLVLDLLGFFLADQIIAMSFTQKDFLARHFGRGRRINVLWGPVDFPIVYRDRPDRPGLTVGYLGNDSWWQGLPYVIAAATSLRSSHPEINFVLAGFNHDDEKKFPPLVNINYLGRIERGRVPGLIQSCDLMLSPRIKSPVSDLQYPHKLSEYLAAGRPVLASAVNDQPRIIEASGAGFIADPLNPETLSEEIVRFSLLTHRQREFLGRSAIDFANRHFELCTFGGNLQRLYQGL